MATRKHCAPEINCCAPKPLRGTPEKWILHQILSAWGNHPQIRVWRANTGKANINGRWVRFNVPGTPDILGVYQTKPEHGSIGVALGIEVKTATGIQSREQKVFQRMYDRMGGLYILARSPDDVGEAIARFESALEVRLARL